ncbi:MAG: ATP-binding protein, partial [Victivallaceae bacterium]|nr:ATP-binding protein [Victivallaceae bacterium]
MAVSKGVYYIRRIRLVNFHNISNVTIPITESGHLFLLGDNGSGKTTVLDAVHYALTAGDQVELNAAARFGGNKKEGRRINEVISCYNVDTGYKYPDGRVTYVALELQGKTGGSVSIGMGFSLTAVNAPVMKWGFIIDVPLEDVPLLGKDENELDYALPRDEFRKSLDSKNMQGYYRSPEAYGNALARRFFAGSDQYKDYCHFLSLCKAYRELCSHTGNNYQQLFKQLLPDPEIEVFERLQRSMQNLNESQNALRGLEDKYSYIRAITEQLKEISKAKRAKVLYSALAEHIAENKLTEDCAIKERLIDDESKNLEKTEEQLAAKKRQKQSLEHRLKNLENKDASGLLRQEKQAADKLSSDNQHKEQLGKTLDRLKNEQNSDAEEQVKLIDNFVLEIKSLAVKLTDGIDKFRQLNIRETLENLNLIATHDKPHQEISREELNLFSNSIDRQKTALNLEREASQRQLDAAKKRFDERQKELDELKATSEAEPDIAGYGSLRKELDNAQLDWTPLYLKLHWRPEVDDNTKNAIEEFIGDRILATVVAEEDSYTTAEVIVFEELNDLRLAKRNINSKTVNPATKEWLNRFFDSGKDGRFLDILAVELDSDTPPELGKKHDCDFVAFRSSLMPLSGRQAKLIGEDARIKEHQRLVADAERAVRDELVEVKNSEKFLTAKTSELTALTRFDKFFNEKCDSIFKLHASIMKLEREKETRQEKINYNQTQFDGLEQNVSALQDELKTLRRQIAEIDVHDLKKQLADLNKELKQQEKDISRIDQNIGSCKRRIEQLETELSDKKGEISACQNRKQLLIAELKAEYQLNEPMREIEQIIAAEHINNNDEAQKKLEAQSGNILTAQAVIRTKIQEIPGKEFGLRFDEELNQVFTRDNRNAVELENSYKNDLEQQRQIINENTSEMFKQIVMAELKGALQKRIFMLEDMTRKINCKLALREFGDSIYSIQIKAHPQYDRLVKMLKNLSVYDQEEIDELRFFFEANSEEIRNTVPGRIPEMLDYRNWYQYNIRVGAKGHDGTVISSRVKSVGSGGEQAVPNYLLVMMIAYFLFERENRPEYIRINSLLFDEAFYG